MSLANFISEWINHNPGKAIGAFLGFIIGICIFSFGVAKTIFILFLVFVGYVIGKVKDEHISITDQFMKLIKRK